MVLVRDRRALFSLTHWLLLAAQTVALPGCSRDVRHAQASVAWILTSGVTARILGSLVESQASGAVDLFYARMKRDPTTPTLVPPLEQPCWPRQAAHCSFQARRERAHPDIGCREQDLWSSLLPRLRGIFPRLRHLQVAARFQLRFDNAGSWSNRRGQCTRILYAVVVVGAARGRARAAAGVKLFGMSVTRSRTRRSCGQGGSSARAAASECYGVHRW